MPQLPALGLTAMTRVLFYGFHDAVDQPPFETSLPDNRRTPTRLPSPPDNGPKR
jgi:hypothetical protein